MKTRLAPVLLPLAVVETQIIQQTLTHLSAIARLLDNIRP